MQEWADFLGCFIAMDENQNVYWYENRPAIQKDGRDTREGGFAALHNSLVNNSLLNTEGMTWKTLYVPALKKGELVFCYNDSDCKEMLPDIRFFEEIHCGMVHASRYADFSTFATYDKALLYDPKLVGKTIAELI